MSRKKRFDELDEYIKALNAERKYRASTSGNKADEPFVTPLLYSLTSVLRIFLRFFAFFCGIAFYFFLKTII